MIAAFSFYPVFMAAPAANNHWWSLCLAASNKGRRTMSPAAVLILEMQIYPIIRNTIHRKAKPVGEDYQELIQDTAATAAAVLDARKRVIVEELMLGGGAGDIARRLAVTSARIVQLKREIGQAIRKFMSDAVLVDSASESVWQRNIRRLRERNEWKHTKLDRIDDPEQVNIAEAMFG